MKDSKELFLKIKETLKSIPKKKKEEQLISNQNSFFFKMRNLNKQKYINISLQLIVILIIVISLLFYLIKRPNNINDINRHKIYSNSIYIKNNYSIVYNNKTIDDPDFKKYQKMLPLLNIDLNITTTSVEDIFNSRQIYISDVRITPEYIRYLRPINEIEEQKYNKRYSENETIIDKNLFKKRMDQYNYHILLILIHIICDLSLK